MRNRLLLAGLGILMIVAAILIFSLSRIELPPAPVGRTLFGGNSGELRASPAALVRASPGSRAGTPGAMPSLEVFAPARFQATPAVALTAPAGTSR